MNINTVIRPWAKTFFIKQITLSILTTLLLLITTSGKISYSFAFGTLSNIIPGIGMACFSFAKCGAMHSNTIIRNFFYGELAKFVLTVSFILIIFISFAINVYAFLIGYLFSVLGYMIIPSKIDKDRTYKHGRTTN